MALQGHRQEGDTDMHIPTSHEAKRGCGYRKPGGLYLVSNGLPAICGRLPLPLTVCPCCGGGIKPARGFTWVNPAMMFQNCPCPLTLRGDCHRTCLLNQHRLETMTRAGLLWVGEGFYPSPQDWTVEALRMGVSRRVHRVPKGLVAGETVVLVAHRKAIMRPCPVCTDAIVLPSDIAPGDCPECHGTRAMAVPGVFHAFIPQRIEYVTKGDESKEALEALVARGITPVQVVPIPEGAEGPGLFLDLDTADGDHPQP